MSLFTIFLAFWVPTFSVGSPSPPPGEDTGRGGGGGGQGIHIHIPGHTAGEGAEDRWTG